MKKNIFVLIIIIISSGLFAQTGYEISFDKPGDAIFQLTFQLNDFELIREAHGGTTYTKLLSNHDIYMQKKGFAELPYMTASVKLSRNKNVSLKIISTDFEEINLENPMLPSRGTIYRNQNPSAIPYKTDPRSITDNWYPANIAKQDRPFILKDFRGTTVSFYPFQYNASKNILRVFHSIKIQLVENDTPPINALEKEPVKILREMSGIYNSIFINYSDAKDDLTLGEYGEILLITTPDYETAIEPYIIWKKEKGYKVTEEIVPTNTNVEELVQNSYDANNNILYVVLVGDWEDIKCGTINSGSPIDPQLGCVAGDDNFADIFTGRISANSAEEVTIQAAKFINYEKSPDMTGDWYKAVTGIASNQGENAGDDNEIDYEHNQNIWVNKLNTFTFDNYNPIYEPTATIQQINDAILGGTSLINYTGHGWEEGWSTTEFSVNEIHDLTNDNKLPWIISVACLNGVYNGATCFAEEWLRKENGGAVMFLGATISQPWAPPMRGQDYIMDILSGGYNYDDHPGQNGINTFEQRTTVGSIIYNSFSLMLTEAPETDLETVQTWVLFGDPALQPRTDLPATINLSNTTALYGIPFETVISDANGPVPGAMVCISAGDEYFSGITDASGTVSIEQNLPPGTAKLVVTGFNLETIYQDIAVVSPDVPWVTLDSFSIDDGGQNNQADYHESLLIDLSAKNVGVAATTNVTATLTSSDPFITIENDSHNYGDFEPGQIIEGPGAFSIQIAQNVPDNHLAVFSVAFTDGTDTWTSSFSVTLHAPTLSAGNFSTAETSGNENGHPDAGESAVLTIQVTNSGSSTAHNIIGTLSSESPYITISSNAANYGDITGSNSGNQDFSFEISSETPEGTFVTFNFEITADDGYTASGTYEIVIGKIPVLVLDLDNNHSSGPVIASEIENNNVNYHYRTDFPEDLNIYSNIFVCLGIYDENHVLTNEESQPLKDYLDNGGNIYLEGGDFWYFDAQTTLRPMFSINALDDGNADMQNISGVDGTFAEGMNFPYSGDNDYMDRIEPSGSAFLFFNNDNPSYGTGVAFDAGSYKTIAATHEFGGLDDTEFPSTKTNLMAKYLNFFGVPVSQALHATFIADHDKICPGEQVNFSGDSPDDAVNWYWEFPGGEPLSSSEQHPTVTYHDPGTYDVTLTVMNDSDTASITKTGLINVLNLPSQPMMPMGDTVICKNDLPDTTYYETSNVTYSNDVIWELLPEEAGTVYQDDTLLTGIIWNEDWEGIATLTAKGVNDCEEGPISEALEISVKDCTVNISELNASSFGIYPNPNNGKFAYYFTDTNNRITSIEIYNTLGTVIYKNNAQQGLDTGNIELIDKTPGVYYMVFNSQEGRKIIKILVY